MVRFGRRAWVVLAVIALATSIAANVVLFRMAHRYYDQYKATTVFPAGLARYAQENRQVGPKTRLRVILFGDSRVEMWRPLPAGNDVEVINRGVNGQTTAQMRLRFDADVLALDPDVVVLQMGINDLTVIGSHADWSNAIETTCATNLAFFVDTLLARKVRVILLTIIPPSLPDVKRWLDWSSRIDVAVNRINRVWLGRVSSVSNLQVIDTRALLFDGAGRARDGMFVDTLHLSADGYEAVDRVVEPAILAARAGA